MSAPEASTAGSARASCQGPSTLGDSGHQRDRDLKSGPCRVPAAPHLKGGTVWSSKNSGGAFLGKRRNHSCLSPGRSALQPHTAAASRRLHLWAVGQDWGDPGGSPLGHMFGQVITPQESSPSALAGSAVTNDHRLGGLNNKHFSQFWKLGSLRSMCWQFLFLSLVFR